MVGNDRSGTVDLNLNLLKAVELALTGGYDLVPFTDPMTGKTEPSKRWGPDTGDATRLSTWDQFWEAYARPDAVHHRQDRRPVRTDRGAAWRGSRRRPISPVWCKGCANEGLDITEGGPELSLRTIEAVTYATTVDSLLAVKYLVFDQQTLHHGRVDPGSQGQLGGA